MAVHVVKVPDIGEGIAEVEVVAWHVQPGDAVAEDQALADVMTDKASVEIPSPVAGTVVDLGGEVGQMLAVGGVLIRIEAAPGAARAGPAVAEAPPPAARPPRAAPGAEPVAAAGAGQRTAPPPPPNAAVVPAPPPQERPIASPALRARAWELGIDLRDVAASGPAGRILQADLDAHLARGGRRTSPAVRSPAAAAAPGTVRAVKIVGLRRKIAQKMQDAKRRIPHYSYVEEVDVTELEALRARLNEQWAGQRGHLTLLPFIVRATTLAVREFPQVNGRFDDEAGIVSLHDSVHLGIATQTDAGLMVPVLRDAQALDLWAVAAGIARLAEAARGGKAVRDELTGSTITITSLGKLGGIASTPVINHPEVAIVGVNRVSVRPVVRDGAIVARLMMNLSSSFDHRVVDGAVGAAFIQRLRSYLESPATAFIA